MSSKKLRDSMVNHFNLHHESDTISDIQCTLYNYYLKTPSLPPEVRYSLLLCTLSTSYFFTVFAAITFYGYIMNSFISCSKIGTQAPGQQENFILFSAKALAPSIVPITSYVGGRGDKCPSNKWRIVCIHDSRMEHSERAREISVFKKHTVSGSIEQ